MFDKFPGHSPRPRRQTTFLQGIALVSLGVVLCVILLELGLRAGGFTFLFFQDLKNGSSIRTAGYRIMCLGESTTAGQYPRFLEQALNQRKIGVTFSVIDKGIPSSNTDMILEDLVRNLDHYRPNLVITMMGVNDHAQFMPQAAESALGVKERSHWRVEKLARLLWLHVTARGKEIQSPSQLMRDKMVVSFGLQTAQDLLSSAGSDSSVDEQNFLFEGWQNLMAGNVDKSERAFNKVLAINSENAQAFYGLSWVYRNSYHIEKIEGLLLKALALKPDSEAIVSALGQFYDLQKEYAKAESFLKRSIGINALRINDSFTLAKIYTIQGRYADAEKVFLRSVAKNPQTPSCYQMLMLFYQERGRHNLAERYGQKLKSFQESYYDAGSIRNYRRLKAVLDERGIRLVCVEYPMRSVDSLKMIFQVQDNVIFVDNEEIFKSAVNGATYDDFFLDMFAGNFGHCTDLGNKLLAGQIANVLLREVFNLQL